MEYEAIAPQKNTYFFMFWIKICNFFKQRCSIAGADKKCFLILLGVTKSLEVAGTFESGFNLSDTLGVGYVSA